MQRIEDVEKRFSEENANLMQYILHSIISFYRNKSLHIEGVTDDDETKELLEQYVYNFVDDIAEDKNQQIIETIRQKVLCAREKCTKYLDETDKKEMPGGLESLEIVSDDVGLVSYLSDEWEDQTFEEYYAHLCKRTAEELKAEIDAIPNSEPYYGMFTLKDYENLLEYCKVYHFNEHIEDMRSYEHELSEYMTLFNVMDYKSPLNIYRQSFILLMTAFDAAVFDITEVILNNHFFEFCNANESALKDGYKLKEIARFGSFDKLKADIIAKILKDNYASGLLKMLYKYNTDYFIDEDNGSDYYNIICEIIARRNLHIHKRGIVDEDYFSQAQGNSYNFNIGDIAYIRSEYYLNSIAYLECLICNLCAAEKDDKMEGV
ncbi:MAG: hypothetical protein IJZ76_06010 [Lachnospiraceae bacterium]|nr:hypothetical protein [Lachnospiraceae bacterium]